jgi:hypothetical protein
MRVATLIERAESISRTTYRMRLCLRGNPVGLPTVHVINLRTSQESLCVELCDFGCRVLEIGIFLVSDSFLKSAKFLIPKFT